jgi:hypothetical protein
MKTPIHFNPYISIAKIIKSLLNVHSPYDGSQQPSSLHELWAPKVYFIGGQIKHDKKIALIPFVNDNIRSFLLSLK